MNIYNVCLNSSYEVKMKFVFFLGCSSGPLCVPNGELVISTLNFDQVYCLLIIPFTLKHFESLEISYKIKKSKYLLITNITFGF